MLIGTNITDWSTVEGAYYAGQGTEAIWLGLSLLLCIVVLVAGSRHESAAYRKAR
ncbi:hypothetical protein [Tabrizicola sp.]|uniref:hypothetical protein n=1 Tax=Tabrizicola sp. TaxID=2005166 RepID=UPI0027376B91|nr:hypothetical protein [Tabrizicola sp.]MDP3197599.1 hypothetical protein [Tabrizicola sp.]